MTHPSHADALAACGIDPADLGDIAQAAQRPDLQGAAQFASEPADVNLDGIGAGFVVEVEQLRGDLVLAEHAPEVADEDLQQPVLAIRQVQLDVVQPGDLGAAVEGELADRRDARSQPLGTAHQCATTRIQLAKIERFG